jgi:CheY-like chemotaxis protein
LTEGGFKVIEADNVEEALRTLSSHSEGFDVLFTDINMPGSVDGLQLARRARRNFLSRLGVVIGSGGRSPPSGTLPSRSRFLPKPYHFSDISDCIRELIR